MGICMPFVIVFGAFCRHLSGCLCVCISAPYNVAMHSNCLTKVLLLSLFLCILPISCGDGSDGLCPPPLLPSPLVVHGTQVGCAFCLPFLEVPRPPFAEDPLGSARGSYFVAPLAAAACASHFGAGLLFSLAAFCLPLVSFGVSCLLACFAKALSEAWSGMISAVTSSSCIL